VQALFEERAQATPDATALMFDSETISYRELNRRANQMAYYLIAQGIGAEDRVGICLDRSPDLIVAVLGILKAGGAYVPLDPGYPSSRLTFMLEDAGVSLLLIETQLAASFSDQNIKTICIDQLAPAIARENQKAWQSRTKTSCGW
jgi:non-ribosomal peptide synthetase component F